ncbi:metal-dependent phosphohydrolase, putative [Bodo saltans]|uniref:5'-deoxynucleotidase n=1 Tax=Bodo saltans TaxID=75058 RepID=A0A0S4J0X2_BODSA|nr:metal-dependent phosphohydrolase, putative [Bodo saltans]|eukprot:CUG37041.1 metal-dependent phosphohydrolase, putative [Bodo saltans]
MSGNVEASNTIEFLHTLGKLKDTPRTGWVENKIPNVESVADHMYRMSVLCMMCPDTTLDKNRMIRMALCHDMAESIVGDISPGMKVPAEVKFERESTAMKHMTSLVPALGGEDMKGLWEEYEAQETAESHFVRDMDLLEMIVQAHHYEASAEKDLSGFYKSGDRIKHPWARQILETLKATSPAKLRAEAAAAAPAVQ